MKIKETLQWALHYYNSTRGVGHSNIAVTGIEDKQSMLIVLERRTGEDIRKTYHLLNTKIETVDRLGSIMGFKLPLVFDNMALSYIFSQALMEINRLEQECNKLESKRSEFEAKCNINENILNNIRKIINNKFDWTDLGKIRKIRSVLNK